MIHPSTIVACPLAALALNLIAAAQAPAPGLRMYAPLMSTDTLLTDTNGQIVHTWPSTVAPGVTAYLESDGTLLRSVSVAGGPAVAGRGGGLQRIALDGTVIWDYRYASATGWTHIDFEPLPNGNVLMLAWDRMAATDAIAAGRDPALLGSSDWLPDAIIEVQQVGPTSGQIVWEWHMMDHVVQDFDATKPNFGVVADHPELLDINFPATVLADGEWNHCNAIDYDPERDVILLNSPFQNEFWFIDHSTTTAEAAGHTGGNFGRGGDFLYRWGNPQAYRAGTPADQKLFFHHGTNFVPAGRTGAGHVLVFNNRAGTPSGMNYSTVVEIDVPAAFATTPGQPYGPAGFLWEYMEATPTDLYSALMSSVERLPNGNTLVCSAQQGGYSFELDPTGTAKVWEHTPLAVGQLVFQCSYLDQHRLWVDTKDISIASGGTLTLDLIAGTEHANDIYLLIGSSSGTTPGLMINGLLLPLNVDGYFVSTVSQSNQFPFGNSEGTLDALGRTTATVTLPGGLLPPMAAGFEFHHAFAIFDATTLQVEQTTNAQLLRWIP